MLCLQLEARHDFGQTTSARDHAAQMKADCIPELLVDMSIAVILHYVQLQMSSSFYLSEPQGSCVDACQNAAGMLLQR